MKVGIILNSGDPSYHRHLGFGKSFISDGRGVHIDAEIAIQRGKDFGERTFPTTNHLLHNPPPSPRKSFEPTRLLRQVRHRFLLDSASS